MTEPLMPSKRRYFKQLRIAQFRAMVELSRGKGFAAAAANLDLATPSVWQQVRALEDELNVTLVDVNGQQVTLTEQGKLERDPPLAEGPQQGKTYWWRLPNLTSNDSPYMVGSKVEAISPLAVPTTPHLIGSDDDTSEQPSRPLTGVVAEVDRRRESTEGPPLPWEEFMQRVDRDAQDSS